MRFKRAAFGLSDPNLCFISLQLCHKEKTNKNDNRPGRITSHIIAQTISTLTKAAIKHRADLTTFYVA